MKKTRENLGGFIPRRRNKIKKLKMPDNKNFEPLIKGMGDRKVSTTMATVRLMTSLLKDSNIGERVVPIVPDEARTFGMEGMFKQIGIYSSEGQKYEPEDSDKVMWYKESKEGVMLEEGITEAGSFSAWIELDNENSNYDLNMIPINLFYNIIIIQS